MPLVSEITRSPASEGQSGREYRENGGAFNSQGEATIDLGTRMILTARVESSESRTVIHISCGVGLDFKTQQGFGWKRNFEEKTYKLLLWRISCFERTYAMLRVL